MNKANFKLIWRNLWKNASISSINILGLSVSIAISALIVLYLQFEYSFDKAHPDHENFHRLTTTFKYPNSPELTTSLSSPMMGPNLCRESDDIDNFLRVIPGDDNFLCRVNAREATIHKSFQVDSSFFSFFDFPLLYGDRATAFDQPQNILIGREISEELFGTENPVGQFLDYTYSLGQNEDTTVHYLISAVFDDLPINSHFQFDALTPIDERQFIGRNKSGLWHGVYANTYFKMLPTAGSTKNLVAYFPEMLKKEMPNSNMIGLDLQAFKNIHLDSMSLEYDHNNYQKTDRKYLRVLGLVALFILLISGINFANLSTALAMRRVQEVGVRKSLGATNGNIMTQFLGEAVLMSAIGGGLALFWVELLEQPFLSMLGKEAILTYSPLMVFGFFGGIILLGILAGVFPATQAAGYSAIEAFQKKATSFSVKRPFVQRLVVVQFVLSGMLIMGAVISHLQLSFLQNKDLGFRYAQVVELNMGMGNGMHAPAIKSELARIPGVLGVTGSDFSLGAVDGQNGVLVRNEETKAWENFPMSINRVEYNYFELYDMQFAQGKSPSPEGAAKENEYVVNEAFIEKVGWKGNPIGQEILRAGMDEGNYGKVVGVIKDIHHNTLHNQISPICFQASEYSPIISMKVAPNNISQVLEKSSFIWSAHIKDKPFEYQFKDEHLAQLYVAENRLGKILNVATALSIFFSCLGLLALSAFIIQQRTKEIGIRKVLGATTAGIVTMLSKDFLKLVFIAILVAVPTAYFFMEKWLQDFAYRIEMEWWYFAGAAVLLIGISFVTVSFQSVRAALVNPVESLKNE